MFSNRLKMVVCERNSNAENSFELSGYKVCLIKKSLIFMLKFIF